MSELFIKRPVMTTLVMLGLFLFGVVACQIFVMWSSLSPSKCIT